MYILNYVDISKHTQESITTFITIVSGFCLFTFLHSVLPTFLSLKQQQEEVCFAFIIPIASKLPLSVKNSYLWLCARMRNWVFRYYLCLTDKNS